MEKDNKSLNGTEFLKNFSNEFADKIEVSKSYHDFFHNVQVQNKSDSFFFQLELKF
jgi:hypothetical protein